MNKYLIRAFCEAPQVAHRLWFLLPYRYRKDYLRRALLKLVAKGDTCFEVGANVGQYTPFLSHLVGPRGNVVAFEPLPFNVATLRARVSALSSYDNVRIESLALSNDCGPVEMYMPEEVGAMASFRRHENAVWAPFKKVTALKAWSETLDGYTARHGTDRLDLLKVDIEGAESLFLDGARKTIERFHPIIVMEVDPFLSSTFGVDPQETFDALRHRGYGLQRKISPDGNDYVFRIY
jgi:FkbM family methyltransferase